jgi:hypothetical protein
VAGIDDPYERERGGRPVRLAALLAVLLVAVLIARLVVVAIANGDRLPADKLEGLTFDGRYFPIEKVCPVLSWRDLESKVGDKNLADEGLLPTGNRFGVSVPDKSASMSCGFTNVRYDRDPRLSIRVAAIVYSEPPDKADDCTYDFPGGEISAVTVGGYRGCRGADEDTVGIHLSDDNALVGCTVTTIERTLLARIAKLMPPLCEELFDKLADARRVPYWGSGFWTWG